MSGMREVRKRDLFADFWSGKAEKTGHDREAAFNELGNRASSFFKRTVEEGSSRLSAFSSSSRESQKAEVEIDDWFEIAESSPKKLERKREPSIHIIDDYEPSSESSLAHSPSSCSSSSSVSPSEENPPKRMPGDPWKRLKGWPGCDDDHVVASNASSSSSVSPSPHILKPAVPSVMRNEVSKIRELISIEDRKLQNKENKLFLVEQSHQILGNEKDPEQLETKLKSFQNSMQKLVEQGEELEKEGNAVFASAVAQYGDTFARDYLILDMRQKDGKEPYGHRYEVLKSMEKALLGTGKGRGDISSERHYVAKDIWRSTLVIKDSMGNGYLVSNLDAEMFDKIWGYSCSDTYTFSDAMEDAMQSDPHFQVPALGDLTDAGFQGKWTIELIDRFFDQQGVSLIHRHRIYSQSHQGILTCYLSKLHEERPKPNRDGNAVPGDLDQRVNAYCQAGFKSGMPCNKPSTFEGWDKAFVDHFNARFTNQALAKLNEDFMVKEPRRYAKSYIIDLQNKSVHCHYLHSYFDPLEQRRKVYYCHIQYDYVQDKVSLTEKEGFEGYPRPETLNELPRFPLAQLAVSK